MLPRLILLSFLHIFVYIQTNELILTIKVEICVTTLLIKNLLNQIHISKTFSKNKEHILVLSLYTNNMLHKYNIN